MLYHVDYLQLLAQTSIVVAMAPYTQYKGAYCQSATSHGAKGPAIETSPIQLVVCFWIFSHYGLASNFFAIRTFSNDSLPRLLTG